MHIPTTIDIIAPIAETAIAHMNSDHTDALLDYARGIAGLAWAQAATVESIDMGGIDLRVVGLGRQELARIPFAQPLSNPAQLRPALVALAQQARSRRAESQVITSSPPVRNTQTAQLVRNAITTRRSFGLKELSPAPIDLELVAQMLEAANWAPSHGKTEPWRFVVYSGAARRIVGDAFGMAFRQLN